MAPKDEKKCVDQKRQLKECTNHLSEVKRGMRDTDGKNTTT